MAINICGECLQVGVLECTESDVILDTDIDPLEHSTVDINIYTPWGQNILIEDLTVGLGGIVLVPFAGYLPAGALVSWNGSFIATITDSTTNDALTIKGKPCAELGIVKANALK